MRVYKYEYNNSKYVKVQMCVADLCITITFMHINQHHEQRGYNVYKNVFKYIIYWIFIYVCVYIVLYTCNLVHR